MTFSISVTGIFSKSSNRESSSVNLFIKLFCLSKIGIIRQSRSESDYLLLNNVKMWLYWNKLLILAFKLKMQPFTKNNLLIAACYAAVLALGMFLGPKFLKENTNSRNGAFIPFGSGRDTKIERVLQLIKDNYV